MHGEQIPEGRPDAAGRLDAPGLLHEMGVKAQAVALTMWKHEIVASLGVCKACGRLPARELPLFGPRCEIAVDLWDLAQVAMRGLVAAPDHHTPGSIPAVGRARVPAKRD